MALSEKMEPALIVRAFVGMVMHHSLNNNLWDPERRLLDVSNETPQGFFTDILLAGISVADVGAARKWSPRHSGKS